MDNIIDNIVVEKDISTTQSAIDKLTMEFMMNRTHYKRYLSKQDPLKFQENQEYIQKIKKYKVKIFNLMTELLDDSINPSSEKYTRDINDSFNEYLKTCVKYFEMQEFEQSTTQENTLFGESAESTEDTLFGESASMNSASMNSASMNSSIWGKSIKKQKNYTMDNFVSKNPTV